MRDPGGRSSLKWLDNVPALYGVLVIFRDLFWFPALDMTCVFPIFGGRFCLKSMYLRVSDRPNLVNLCLIIVRTARSSCPPLKLDLIAGREFELKFEL